MISIDLPMNNAEILVCYNTKENYPHLRAFSETEVMAATQKVVLSTKQPVWRSECHGGTQHWMALVQGKS